NEGFRLHLRKKASFQNFDFACKPAEVLLEAEYCSCKLHAKVQAGGMFAAERDHIAAEGEIVADEYGEPRTELDGHGLVVRGAESQSRTAVRSLAVGKLQDAEEDRAIAAQGKALLLDANLVLLQDGVEHVHQLDVRNRLEGAGHFGRGQRAKFR